MASSYAMVICLCVLVVLASSPTMIQAARLTPNDHGNESTPSRGGSSIATSAPPSQDLPPQVTALMAAPIPPSPPAGKAAISVAKRWGTTEITDGSVPSPGAGH
ncbi:hypothetical protein ACP70R_035039 [Stipagrostis hirtigluma subsp. patula]